MLGLKLLHICGDNNIVWCNVSKTSLGLLKILVGFQKDMITKNAIPNETDIIIDSAIYQLLKFFPSLKRSQSTS